MPVINDKCLGKRPARPGAVALKFKQVFKAAELPKPPQTFGRRGLFREWGVLANDQVGDCVFAGAAHETMLWARESGAALQPTFSADSVVSDYSAVTGYDPKVASSDQGTDMQVAASYRRKTGVLDACGRRHVVDAYLDIKPGDLDSLFLAAYLTGAVGFGMRFPSSAMDQFDAGEPWDVFLDDRIVGGHYVPVIDRTASGNLVVITWGREQEVTPQWYETYCDESIAYISSEYMSAKALSPEGFDAATLQNFLNQLA